MLANILFLTPFALYLGCVAAVTLTVRSRGDDADFFFAKRRLGTIPALLSVVSTETSVATTVIFPAAGLKGGYVLVWMLLGYIVGRTIVAVFYLRALYESSRLTIYQTMSGHHRVLESTYLLAKYISGGVRYFIGGYALHQILGGPTWLWLLAVAVFAGAYSLTGGLRAVVAMDQIQSALIVGVGVFLCVFLLRYVPAGGMPVPAFVNLRPNEYTFTPVLFLAGAVLSIGSHGADQDLLLRILSTKTFGSARRSLILSGFAAAFLIGIYLTVGYLLQFAPIANLDPKSPLADYIIRANLPLVKGLFLVLLSAAAMSSMDSTIHSTGAIWKSLMRSERPGRYWSALSLLIMIGFALLFMALSKRHSDFLALCMGSMNYVNGGLIGIVTVFAFFPRRLNAAGIVAGLIAGFAATTVCEWAFPMPVPWTYTVLLASSLSFLACMAGGTIAPGNGAAFRSKCRR
jgi:Na+/proline symporter